MTKGLLKDTTGLRHFSWYFLLLGHFLLVVEASPRYLLGQRVKPCPSCQVLAFEHLIFKLQVFLLS